MPSTSNGSGRGSGRAGRDRHDEGRPYRYRAFGLGIDSELELPEMMPRSSGGADVTIRYGEVPDTIPDTVTRGARHQLAEGQFLLHMEGIAGYWVRGREDVVVEPRPGSKRSDVRVFLLGSVMGAVLHANEILPLHASAVDVGGECVLFTGAAGYGKSTLAAACHARGYPLQSDDVSAVSLDSGDTPVVHPGYRAIKLWADALDHLGEGLGEARRLRTQLEKYSVLIPRGVGTGPLPVRAIFTLVPTVSAGADPDPVVGRQKIGLLLHETYRRRFLAGMGRRDVHFNLVDSVAQTTPVLSIERPLGLSGLEPFLDRVEEAGWSGRARTA